MCISCFTGFSNDLLLAVYFILILVYRNDIRQKANLRSFLICIKNGRKAEEVIHNISNTFGPGTANEHTVQWWFKKFCKGDESLENEEPTSWPL